MSRTRTSRQFRFEGLEDRRMMAGDIHAYVHNGDLYITEAVGHVGSDHGVRIAQLANGKIQVTGDAIPTNGHDRSTVNGGASAEFTVTGSLFVNLGGGEDRVQIGHAGGGGAPNFENMTIDVAGPAASLSQGFTTGPLTGQPSDADDVFVWSAVTRGSTTINTGRGNDFITTGFSTYGDGVGSDKLTINAGEGADNVTMRQSWIRGDLDVQTYGIASEQDPDVIFIDAKVDGLNYQAWETKIDGHASFRTGGGDDRFFVSNPTATDAELWYTTLVTHGTFKVDTGAGNDTVLMRAAMLGDSTSDDVAFDDVTINTGAGADTVTLFKVSVGTTLDIQTFTSALENDRDVISLKNTYTFRDMNLRTGGGADEAVFDGTAAYRFVNVDLGAGDDSLDLRDYVFGLLGSTLNGGDGFDTLKITSNSLVNNSTRINWESINGVKQTPKVPSTTGGALAPK
jgi:hypothetical protein